MTPERWAQIDQLYEAYLAQPPGDRTAFLDRACAGDDALRAELESLLAAEKKQPAFLETSFAGLPAPAGSSEPARQRVGPYRLIRLLGRGGMGTVYLAERADGQFRHIVALKLARHGLFSDDLLSRFTYERQILAALDHPNIAHLHDGGTTDDGRPYFAMEYVDGVPLTNYCDTHRLSTQQRLTLFRTVCRAVQYAHRNLVIHRDLKPSNILVTEEGTVKLLDFGIAKLLDDEVVEQTAPQTQTGMRLMTPEYASPEQIKGEAITTATDVYQLGVLLYELLTGRRPYRLSERVRHEIARVILEEEPTRPSTVVQRTEKIAQGQTVIQLTPYTVSQARSTNAQALRRRLSGDLDNIVLKALKKEPERRYASVEQLAEDVRRHLAGLPVLARGDTVRYRAAKFVRRHKVGVVMGAAFALVLLGFSIVTAVQSAQVRANAEEATLERDKAEQVVDFLVDLFESPDPSAAQGETITARDLLERGAARIEEELAEQPAVQAEMLEVLGRVHRNLGAHEDAEPLARRALDVRRTLYGPEHPEVIESIMTLAEVRRTQGDYDEADSLWREALTISRKALGDEHLLTAASLHGLGVLRGTYKEEQKGEAEAYLREALAIRRKVLGENHRDVTSTLIRLASLLRQQRKFDEAEPLLREALTIRRAQYGDEHIYTANSLAMLLTVKDDVDEAEPLYREALAIYRKQLDPDHPSIATILFNLGRALIFRRDFQGAEPVFREVLALRRTQFGDVHPRVASAVLQLGRVLHRLDRHEEAEPLLQEAVSIRQEVLGATSWQVGSAGMELGICLTAQARYEEAEERLEESIALLKAGRGPEDHLTHAAQDTLAYLYQVWGKPAPTAPQDADE